MDAVPLLILALVVAVVALGQFAVWVVLVQLIQQQGRMLLRLDNLAEASATLGDRLPVIAATAEPVGLPVGSPIGDFQLPDVAGHLVGPTAWRRQRTLLVHWSVTCGFCDLIAPKLARLEACLHQQGIGLVLASHGDAQANRLYAEEHGLRCPIVLQSDTQPIDAFRHLGTPVAYLLDAQAQVAEPLVSGADPVLALARRLAAPAQHRRTSLRGERPLSESHIERNGIKAGTPAPDFTLPATSGGSVTLSSYRGRRVLVVFTDPHCGPCDALAPDLARLGRAQGNRGLNIVVVGRGAADENRRKAEQYEFTFPLVLQKHWEVSKAYGIFATPVGFLVDERGVIARDVAIGPDAIAALAEKGLTVSARKELENGRAVR
jgi:peroxiredoxin